MRAVVIAAALAVTVTACGSPAEQAVSGPDSTSTIPATTSTTSSTPAPTTTGGTVPGERPPDDEQSGSGDQAYPEDGFPPEEDESVRLSIDDALLPDDAFGPPWELQWRQLDAAGFGAGPNQTDCDEYWAYEELLAGDGGHAMWWIDGGNANHRVFRFADETEVLPRLLQISMIAENCPVVRWFEGGEFTVELFTPDVEAFIEVCPVAVAFDRFDEVLAWESDLRNSEGREATQIIGEMGDPGGAAELIQQFAEVAVCDLSVLAPGATGRGGVLDIEGADLAAVVVIEAPELDETSLHLGAAAVGSTVVVFTVDSDLDRAAADEQLRELMTLAVAKIDAGSS